MKFNAHQVKKIRYTRQLHHNQFIIEYNVDETNDEFHLDFRLCNAKFLFLLNGNNHKIDGFNVLGE